MILFTVYTLKDVGAWLVLLGFKIRRINLEICFATPFKLTMILGFVRTIILGTSRSLKIVHEHYVVPLLAVFALENTRVHVGTSDSCDETFYIEALINDLFCRQTIL